MKEQLKKETRLLMVASFGLPFLIMIVMFVVNRIYPFGDRSFLCTDMYHQYTPFFAEFVRKIKAGEGLAYSYNIGAGSNFLALYAYYLASPLHWLVFLFPEKYLIEFMSYLCVIKIGLCGLTAGYYFRKHFDTGRNVGVILFACFYALSGFMAAYNWNIMWLDCVVLLPLIMLGLEALVRENKCRLYCLTLGLSILTNFYISIMICIFLVLYFVVQLVVWKRCSFRIFKNFALYSLLAAGMAAVLLIPSVCALLETDFGDMDFPKKVESYFSVLEMLVRHCMCIETERGLDHWPNIYCGVAAFMMVPMFALNKKIPMRERFAYLALSGFILLGFSTNILNFIWHGLNWPDSLPARQSFIYCFCILIMCYGAYKHIMDVEPKHILYGYLATVVFFLYCEEFVPQEQMRYGVVWLNLLFVTAYAVVLYLYRTRKDRLMRQILVFAAFALVASESGINTVDTSIWNVSRSEYLSGLEDYGALYEMAKEDASKDGEVPFFRIEKFDRKTKNDGALAGYPTATVFSSTMNSYVMDMYKQLGMRYSKVFYEYSGATFFTSALLNVDYIYGMDARQEGPLYTNVANSGKISLYRAEQTLPFGYVAPTEYDIPTEGSNPLIIQNQMVGALDVDGLLFVKQSAKEKDEDVQFTALADGYYYGVVTSSGTAEIASSANGEIRTFTNLKKKSIIHLGYVEKDTLVTMTNSDDEDESRKIKVDVYRMNAEVLEDAIEKLSQTHLYNVEYDSTHISGEIDMKREGRLILSVPYEKGWTVLLNGEEVVPQLFGGTLMAFDLNAGEYTLELSYRPYGSMAGMIVSGVSIAIFAAIILCSDYKNRGKLYTRLNCRKKGVCKEIESEEK